jgi:methionine synthase I (cobalamin-dependent)
VARVRGVRANASTKSHAELDEATELDDGDPDDLASRHGSLRLGLPSLSVVGGCCGTDHRHVEAICRTLL